MSNILTINAGTDFTATMSWPDGAGGNADLTGFTASAFMPDGLARTDWVDVSITDAATGEITITIDWADDLPEGKLLSFYPRIEDAQGNGTSTTKVWVKIQ